MKRTALVCGLICLMALLTACNGGNGVAPDPEAGPLAITLLWAEPSSGASPLRVVFTANITGGLAPYYYAWDFTNDGSVDRYLNGEFRRTVSVLHDYYLRASDPGGLSQYEAVLTVTDSQGTVVAGDAIQVSVLGTTGLTFNTELTEAFSDEVNAQGFYVFRSGQPVYFRAYMESGTPPYQYQYDFDNDGAVDSTVASPQYTFTYTGPGVRVFPVNLTVVDGNGEAVLWIYYVEIQGEGGEPQPGEFTIIVNSTPPADSSGVINVFFDPTGTDESLKPEPKLDLAVIVDPYGGGLPPFEYYWDFENDGAFDSQALSPTIPYYDHGRKILINPYMHTEDKKSFTLRCMVIDSSGALQEEFRTVVATNLAARPEPIDVDYTYGVLTAPGGAYSAIPPVPYARVADRTTETSVKFEFDIVGGAGGTLEYQFDANGDGVPEVPSEDEWQSIPADADGFEVPITFKGAGYFPAAVTIRSLGSAGTPVDMFTIELPVSLVQRNDIQVIEGTLIPRTDHCIAADWAVSGEVLSQREFLIVGGAQGSTPQNTVERVLQTYTPPAGPGKIETLAGTFASSRPPLNQERRGSVMWADGPENGTSAEFHIHGGWNVINGFLASNEMSSGGGGDEPWAIMGEILIPAYYPLKDMAGTAVPGVGFVMAGGLHKASEAEIAETSGRLIVYDPVFDSYGQLATLIKPRYDASIAYANGKIYVIGGRTASGESVATVEAYDPLTGQWDTFTPAMLEPRAGAACQVVGGQVYVIGGAYWPPDESERTLLYTAEVFNPATGVWSDTLPLPDGVGADNIASTVAPAPGGVDSGGALANAMIVHGGEDLAGEKGAFGPAYPEDRQLFYEFVYFHVVEAEEPPPPTAMISGHLTRESDGTPVEGIRVDIGNGANWPAAEPNFADDTLTDADGYYEFIDLPTGTDRSYLVAIIFVGGYTWDPPFGREYDPFMGDVIDADFVGTPEP